MKIYGLFILCSLCSACTTLRNVDAALYGEPPAMLASNATVFVDFGDPVSVSMKCSMAAFGPLGVLAPVHGCVQARKGEPIRMITTIGADALHATYIVEFTSPERAKRVCESSVRVSAQMSGLPEKVCLYQPGHETRPRLVWPNPCATGDMYMCHELGHVNQYRLGWVQASAISPRDHWGRAPRQVTSPYRLAQRQSARPNTQSGRDGAS